MKAIEQYCHVVLFIMLYQVVLTFKSVEETLVCDNSNESYWAVLLCDTVYYAAQDGANFKSGLTRTFIQCLIKPTLQEQGS